MTAYVLVVNAGSSSLKYRLVDAESGETPANGVIEQIGEPTGRLRHVTAGGERLTEEGAFPTFERALRAAVDAFEQHGPSLREAEVVAVGHRVVHGGDFFAEPTLIDDDVVARVSELAPLAPLHNPANLEGIEVGRKLFPGVPQVAVFDTAYHQTMPPVAYTYAIPAAWREDHKIRRYGFHGTSHHFVAGAAAALLGRDPQDTNLVVLHLGNGASATAVRGGESVDTSMGLTPLEGLVMGTRSGDIDPAIPAHLHRELGWSLDDIDHALNHDSGLKGLCGHNDSREVEELRARGERCRDARLRRLLLPHPQVRRRLLRGARQGRRRWSSPPASASAAPRRAQRRWPAWSAWASQSTRLGIPARSRDLPLSRRTPARWRCWWCQLTRSGKSPGKR